MIKFLDLHKQYLTIKNEIDFAISSVINSGEFVGGSFLKKFEDEFALFNRTKYCVGVGNGTDALEISIEALNFHNAGEIIVPANSFIASAEAVSRSGLKVVFCNVNPDDYTIDINDVRRRITENTCAIMAVHLYGHPCNMDALLAVAQEYGLKVIEDCAQAHGAEYRGRRVGSIGDVGCFSFYPGKNLGAYGDAGAIVTNDPDLATKCRMIANHGRIAKYDHEFEGRNSRLDGLQAAILSVKLKYLEQWTEKRIQIAEFYLESLSNLDQIVLPKRKPWAKQVYHLFVISTSDRDSLKDFLATEGIQSAIHYPKLLPKLHAYRYLRNKSEYLLESNFNDTLLSLPIGEHMSHDDAHSVVSAIKKFYT